MHPAFQLRHERRHLVLPHEEALLGRQAVEGPLDVEDRVDAPHRLGRERRLGELRQVEQLAPAVALAASLGHRTRSAARVVEFAEPAIGVGLQDAGIAGQVPLRVLAPAIG